MKKFMSIVVVMAFALGMSVSSAIGAELKWREGGTYKTIVTKNVGQTVTVELWATDIGGNGAAGFDVGEQFNWFNGMNYDPSWLQCNSVTVDATNWTQFTYQDWTSSSGNINAGGCGPTGTCYIGDKRLITIEFECLGSGTETFDFTEINPDMERFYLVECLTMDNMVSDPGTNALSITCEAAVNHAPVAVDDNVTTFKNTSINIDLIATDEDSDPLDYIIVSLPSDGNVTDKDSNLIGSVPYILPDNDNTVTYTPYADSCNDTIPDSFTFMANDGQDDSNVATVNVLVKCTNAVQMVMPRLWPCTPPYHWWFENPDQYSEGAQSAHPSMTATPNEEVCFYINYDAFDGAGNREKELSGISFWVSYDSDFLEISDPEKDIKHIFPKGYVNVLNAPEIICDGNNCKFLMAWADPSSPPAWPNEPLPLEILKVCFMVPSDAVTGTSTMVTFSDDPHTAVGYSFYSEDMTVKIVDFNIDIDGNNDVEPLTDGLLITRYLFGFMGNNLVSGAVDPLGSRAIAGASEIADWIERGRVEPAPTDNGGYTHLDIDKNTEVTALTDGIMILRQLFGYTGANLTAGALGPNATRSDSVEIATYIEGL